MPLSLYERSFLPVGHDKAIGDLTIPELAQLRLSSLDMPVMPDAYDRLVRRMTSQGNQGFLVLKERITKEWVAGEYKRTEIISDGPLEGRGKSRVIIVSGNGPRTNGLPKNMNDIIENVVTPNAAFALFKSDPPDWSDGSLNWCSAQPALSEQELIRLGVPMTLDEVNKLKTVPRLKHAIKKVLMDLGYEENFLKSVLDKKTEQYQWVYIARTGKQGEYYMSLLIHLFSVMQPLSHWSAPKVSGLTRVRCGKKEA